MMVSLITDLRFPSPGQQGHGARIIHEEAWNLADEICKILSPNGEDDICELMTEIQERSRTDVDAVMNIFEKEGYFKEAVLKDGPDVNPVYPLA